MKEKVIQDNRWEQNELNVLKIEIPVIVIIIFFIIFVFKNKQN